VIEKAFVKNTGKYKKSVIVGSFVSHVWILTFMSLSMFSVLNKEEEISALAISGFFLIWALVGWILWHSMKEMYFQIVQLLYDVLSFVVDLFCTGKDDNISRK